MRVETILRIGAFISIPKNASKTVLHVLELGENRNTENTDSPIIFENHQRGGQYHFIDNCKIDYVGRMENFEQDFKTIVQKLNTICEERSVSRRFSSRNELHNTSRRQSDPARYYTTEIREQVYHLLEKDFTYFGYEK